MSFEKVLQYVLVRAILKHTLSTSCFGVCHFPALCPSTLQHAEHVQHPTARWLLLLKANTQLWQDFASFEAPHVAVIHITTTCAFPHTRPPSSMQRNAAEAFLNVHSVHTPGTTSPPLTCSKKECTMGRICFWPVLQACGGDEKTVHLQGRRHSTHCRVTWEVALLLHPSGQQHFMHWTRNTAPIIPLPIPLNTMVDTNDSKLGS